MKTTTVRHPGRNPYLVISHGSCSARIYRRQVRKSGKTYTEHILKFFEGGSPKARYFADLEEAKREAKTVLTRLANGQTKALQLTDADAESYLLAVAELEPSGIPLLTAAREYARAMELLKGKATVLEAARSYANNGLGDLPIRTVPEVVAEMLEAKRRDRLSAVYLRDLSVRLKGFATSLPGPIGEIKAAELDAWLRGLDLSPRSRNNAATSVTTLFRFARRAGYLPPDRATAADSITRAKETPSAVEIYTPDEIRSILNRLVERRPKLLPFIAIGAFAGLRSAEIERLNWEDIRLDEGFIHVAADKAKTGQRRLVPIQPNLATWLAPYRDAKGPVCTGKRPQVRVQDAVEAIVRDDNGDPLSTGWFSVRPARLIA